MKNFVRVIAQLGLLAPSVSFHIPGSSFRPSLRILNAVSYLNSLGGTVRQQQKETPPGNYLDALSRQSAYPTSFPAEGVTLAAGDTSNTVEIADSLSFPYAPIEYFDLCNLKSKGARSNADWGTPSDSSRRMASNGKLSGGSWWCSEGGWPSPSPKAHTEIFYVLEGNGCLGDADGKRHYFGPGDTVIIPKGHTGRWDVLEPIHKIWAVNAHDRIEEESPIIRTKVDGYHTFAPHRLTWNTGYDPLYNAPHQQIASHTFYNVGPTKVGVWTCSPSSFPVKNGPRSFFHMLEGVVVVTDGVTKEARRCVAGDTVMLPAGWSGHIDVIEVCKKLWTTAE